MAVQMAGTSQTNSPRRSNPTRPQKNGTEDAKPAKKNVTSQSSGDNLLSSAQTVKANQAQAGRNQRIFCGAV